MDRGTTESCAGNEQPINLFALDSAHEVVGDADTEFVTFDDFTLPDHQEIDSLFAAMLQGNAWDTALHTDSSHTAFPYLDGLDLGGFVLGDDVTQSLGGKFPPPCLPDKPR